LNLAARFPRSISRKLADGKGTIPTGTLSVVASEVNCGDPDRYLSVSRDRIRPAAAIETLTPGPRRGIGMSEAAVDEDEVRHVADLARVDLDGDEVAAFAAQFAEILEYFETLDEVPEVEEEADLVNVMRADEVREGLTQEEALRNAPETEEGYFKGPRVS
jgi:aspartyl-tRNA(Asn)/glutamyl-tRNA(Gln) amidotransferase subunit C